jgi:hypothetical protein
VVLTRGFAIKADKVFSSYGKEETAIISYCVLNRIPYRMCIRPQDRPEGYIPCGSVKWCENFLPKEKTVPDACGWYGKKNDLYVEWLVNAPRGQAPWLL